MGRILWNCHPGEYLIDVLSYPLIEKVLFRCPLLLFVAFCTLLAAPTMFFVRLGFPVPRVPTAFAQLYFRLLGTLLPAPRRLRFSKGLFNIGNRVQFDKAEDQDNMEHRETEVHQHQVTQEEAAAEESLLGVDKDGAGAWGGVWEVVS